jgi:hypothetical protein
MPAQIRNKKISQARSTASDLAAVLATAGLVGFGYSPINQPNGNMQSSTAAYIEWGSLSDEVQGTDFRLIDPLPYKKGYTLVTGIDGSVLSIPDLKAQSSDEPMTIRIRCSISVGNPYASDDGIKMVRLPDEVIDIISRNMSGAR